MFSDDLTVAAPRDGLDGLQVEGIGPEGAVAQFDLSVFIGEIGAQGIALSCIYATDLFDASTIERFAAHFVSLVEAVVSEPEAGLDDLPLLPAAERARVTRGWNDTAVDYGGEADLMTRFEALAAAEPERVALVAGAERLSYAALNRRANRLAHWLRTQGVGSDSLVGVAMERSVEMVVALLGILKAGGAYVPFDPDYPAERLQGMLEQSGIGLILAQGGLLERLPPGPASYFCLDREAAVLADCAETDPVRDFRPDALAYCIFTSGSTGRPKPVGNSHAGLANRLDWMQQAYGLGAGDVVLQKTPYSFDVSVWEFFWPLITGARLVMAAPGAHRDPLQLRETIVSQGVTTLHFVPSMLQAFLEAGALSGCDSLRQVMCSGEALPSVVAARFRELHGAALHNLYGPTEAAIDVTFWACREEVPGRPVPIGRPIANTQIYVLDASLNPVPVGVPGEIYIGGVNLARGYLGQPGLTAERFVCDPLGPAGARLYRTGDLGRWRADGEIEFRGRRDNQVKLRGFRIELGEIEACLASHPEVGRAAAFIHETAGRKQLVGYVAPDGSPDLAERLKVYLKDYLPDYMIPSPIMVLDSLPLSKNGKLDRKALPEPRIAESRHVAPASRIEVMLAEVWQSVLGLETVGTTDNFFELGGDSIVAILVVSKCRQRGVKLNPRDIFQHQTIQGLAGVATLQAEGAMAQPVPTGEAPLLPIQQWFFEQDIPHRHHWNQAVLLRPQAAVDRDALAQALGALVSHHDGLRLRFWQDEAGAWRQAYGPVAEVDAAALLWHRDAVDDDAFDRAVEETHRSLDLAEGPLLRACLMTLGDGTQRLLLAIHHLVVDGVSWRILLEDLQAAYLNAAQGVAPELPARSGAYGDWARSLADGPRRSAAAEGQWWADRLSGPVTPLPVDREEG